MGWFDELARWCVTFMTIGGFMAGVFKFAFIPRLQNMMQQTCVDYDKAKEEAAAEANEKADALQAQLDEMHAEEDKELKENVTTLVKTVTKMDKVLDSHVKVTDEKLANVDKSITTFSGDIRKLFSQQKETSDKVNTLEGIVKTNGA